MRLNTPAVSHPIERGSLRLDRHMECNLRFRRGRMPKETDEAKEKTGKTDKQQPEIKRPPKTRTDTELPEAIPEDVAVEDRFQSTDN
jgi:hypothetical protein